MAAFEAPAVAFWERADIACDPRMLLRLSLHSIEMKGLYYDISDRADRSNRRWLRVSWPVGQIPAESMAPAYIHVLTSSCCLRTASRSPRSGRCMDRQKSRSGAEPADAVSLFQQPDRLYRQ